MDRILAVLNASPVAVVIFVTILVFSIAAFQNERLYYRWMLRPYDMVRNKSWWMLISSGFIHANLQHLILNCLTFYFIVFDLERIMVIKEVQAHYENPSEIWLYVGHVKFFFIYFASLIVSDLTTVIKYKDDRSYASLGASGAISGMVMAFILFAPDVLFWGFIPGWIMGLGYVIYSYFAAKNSRDNIGHEAHLWGAIAGLVFTTAMFPGVIAEFFSKITLPWVG